MFQPRFLRRPEAAAYVGVCVTVFDAEVKSGIWPLPLRRGRKGDALTWDVRAIDAAADRLSGLMTMASRDSPDTGEQAALEIARALKPPPPRIKRGQEKAA